MGFFGGANAVRVLGKRETVAQLVKLIDEASSNVWLVCPFVRFSEVRDLERAIQGALERRVSVTLFTRAPDATGEVDAPLRVRGKTAASNEESIAKLRKAGLTVKFVRDLHAKIYLSDLGALVSSLNLTGASFSSSIEIGMWLSKSGAEFDQVLSFVKKEIEPHSVDVRRTAIRQDHLEVNESDGDDQEPDDEPGRCLACSSEIDFDPKRPYCIEDYRDWAEAKDRDQVEKFCHGCGKEHPATMAKPLCSNCFREFRSER